jgi:uncharacterized protein YuzE
MKQPIDVRTDLSVRAAYIEYAPALSVGTVDLTETGSVAYDVDAAGNVVGIEILGIDHLERIDIARVFAASRDLAFPRDLTGTPVPA